ncbi:MAG TPA: GNAT family N-acetyltransferase [Rhodoglobus sp.]|nr:GNAT family N-acetyltransferase [Rhodoglobus sp.]HQG70036.1 GNAT family N-acetyltransferase [Rhodoglobus sp.]HQI66423.1 GNAT family N-acetyltransferase [Rhodoglobus sp.]HQJ35228.1 GNAT family N-acetyltransferase [Rhodoglobus sp.]
MIEPVEIRLYRPADRADVYNVCVRTAAAGGDATGIYSSDDLMPDVFAGPYLAFQPDLAFVVDVGDRVAGYVIAAADTRAFVERVRQEWVPTFASKYPEPSPTDAPIVAMGVDPERMLVPEVDEYPAHLHIDLLPELQGQGCGRALIDTLRTELARRGIPGLHLTMDPANLPARAFYDRLGFVELPSGALGISTA